MAQEWDIKPRATACSKCAAQFADNQFCYSLLTFGQEGYARGDYCQTCWEEIGKTGSSFSSWKGVYKSPPPPAEEPLKKETAESLLRRLMQDDDKSKKNVIYILAVMLERKRILAERDTRLQEGIMVRVYEHKKTGETFVITDPGLKLDQLGEVEKEVAEMLGWNSAPSKPAVALQGDTPNPPAERIK